MPCFFHFAEFSELVSTATTVSRCDVPTPQAYYEKYRLYRLNPFDRGCNRDEPGKQPWSIAFKCH